MGDENSIPSPRGYYYNHAPRSYALSGKIMLSAIVILFTVVLFILCLHLYARCFLLRRRRQEILRRRRAHVFSSVDPIALPGLAAAILRSLPVFVFSSNTHKESLECAVCLSEFQENEKGRLLPKCNHSFHIECIDMWFHSHATCPICRADVESEIIPARAAEVGTGGDVESGSGSETASSSAFCESCRDAEGVRSLPSSSSDPAASSSESSRRKGLEFVAMRVEVPRRSECFRGTAPEEEMIRISPAGQGVKSPGSRILSLKKILSKDRRFSPTAFSCSSGQEIDLERGEEESQLQR